MESSSNWCSLPSKIKAIIIRNLDNGSRLALRSTSKCEKQLVDSVPFRKIHSITLNGRENRWYMKVTRKYYSSEENMKFDSFSEFQEKVLVVLNEAGYVKELAVHAQNTEEVLKLTTSHELLKVQRLTINVVHAAKVLCQIDPFTLIDLTIQYDENDSKIYDLPQVLQAEELSICHGCIQDDQLMNLKARKIWTTCLTNVTKEGYTNYIKKSIKNPNFDRFQCTWPDETRYKEIFRKLFFRCVPGERKFVIDPLVPEFETRFEESGNLFIGERNKALMKENTYSTHSKLVKEIRIQYDELDYTLFIDFGDHTEIWNYDAPLEIQDKLAEQIESISYVKKLEVLLESHTCNWNITPGNGQKLAVGHVSIDSHDKKCRPTVVNLLNQIDPNHLKCVEIFGKISSNPVFEMKQLINAEYVKVTHPNIRDDQLMEVGATTLILGMVTGNQSTSSKLTAAGVNKYIKKCLSDLDKKAYELELTLGFTFDCENDIETLLEGFNICNSKVLLQLASDSYHAKYTFIFEHPVYQLQLEINGRQLKARRVYK